MKENKKDLKQKVFNLSYINGLKDQQIEILKTALKNNVIPVDGRTLEEECSVQVHIAEVEIADR